LPWRCNDKRTIPRAVQQFPDQCVVALYLFIPEAQALRNLLAANAAVLNFAISRVNECQPRLIFFWDSFRIGSKKDFDLFTTSFRIEQNWIKLKEGDFSTSLAIYRLDSCFTPFISLANFVQYHTDSRNIGLQSRLRWILKSGNEFFVVLNHSWQENNLNRFESARTRFRSKLNYTFRL
jgi:hypothetical protein